MPGKFTTVEVTDPHQTSRLIWESLPLAERVVSDQVEHHAREFGALDWRRFQTEPESFRSEFSFALVGATRVSRVAENRATHCVMRPPGIDMYCVSLMAQGTISSVQRGSAEPAVGNAETGLVFDCEPGTKFAASDGSVRFHLWIPGRRIRERLEVLLDGQPVKSFAFQPVFDQTRGPGATIHHMLDFLFVELARSDSLLANEIATRTFEDNLALCLLLGLPHSHTARLQQQSGAAAPGNVRRAEEFMRGNPGASLTIPEIAQAAGCSVRALQTAFQRFRGTTPMAALRRFRLEAARTEILRAGRTESLTQIAADYGFSNPSRFAQVFRRTYGTYPSEALRTRGGLDQEGEPSRIGDLLGSQRSKI
jgi:AraC-like DNA-binding protein